MKTDMDIIAEQAEALDLIEGRDPLPCLKIELTPSELKGIVHEIWAAAQLLPKERIEDAVERIRLILVAKTKRNERK